MLECSGVSVLLYSTPVAVGVEAFIPGRELSAVRILEAVRWRAPWERTRVFVNGEEISNWDDPLLENEFVCVVGVPADPGTLAAIAAFFTALGDAVVATATFGAFGGAYAGAATVGAFGTAGAIGASIGSIVGGAALAYGTSALIGSLVKPPDQDMGKSDGGNVSPTLQDLGNAVRPNAPYPYVAGDFRIVPPICYPHSYVKGGESIFLAVFIVGLGEHSFSSSDILIGDLPLTAFDRAEVAIRQGALSDPGLSLFTRNVVQSALSSIFDPIDFDDPELRSPWVQHQVPGEGHSRLGIDFNFTQGVFRRSDTGRLQIYHFGLQIEYRKNSGSWSNALVESSFSNVDTTSPTKRYAGNPTVKTFQGLSILQFRGQSSRPFQTGFTWNVTGDADDVWEIRIRRVEDLSSGLLLGSGGSLAVGGQVVWFAIKGFRFDLPPMQTSGVATVELQVPLDEQFSGLQQNFSVRVRRKCRIYNPAASGGADADGWSNLKFVTSNNAAIIRDMLQGENNRVPALDSEIDVDAFTAFYEFCEDFNDGGTGALEFNHVFDARFDLIAACQTVAAAGRGRFGQDSSGRFTVLYDGPRSGTERFLINAANCRSFKLLNVFAKPINAIRAQYVNAEDGFDPDAETTVYRDGYSSSNPPPEEEIGTRSYIGTTSYSKVFARARYDLADQELRPRQIEVEMNLEQLGIPVNSLVRFSHPGSFIGEAWGRVHRSTPVVYRDSFDSDFHPYSGSSRMIVNGIVVWGDFDGGSVAHGRGAAVLTSNSSSAASIEQELAAEHNWSGFRFDLHAQPGTAGQIDASDGLRIRLAGPTVADFKEWRFGSGDGLSASALNSVGASLASAADVSGGSFDATRIRFWKIYTNVIGATGGLSWRADNFRISRTDGALVEVALDQVIQMQPGANQYALEYRHVDTVGIQNEIQRKNVRPLSFYGVVTAQNVTAIYLETPIAADTVEPQEGDLYSFGLAETVSIRAIVKNKVAGSDFTARLSLVDEAPGMHTSTGTVPPFESGISLGAPIARVGPAAPTIRQVITDERALTVAGDGTLRPRILVDVVAGTAAGRPRPDFWSLKYRRILPSTFDPVSLARVDASASQLVISDVDEGATYELTLQAITKGGLVSAPTRTTVLVLGKTGAPPDVENFRVEGSNLQWSLSDPPADLAGFRIRRGPVGSTFTQALSIHGDTLLTAAPFSISALESGLASFFIVSEDLVGNQSNPVELTAFSGTIPEQNIVNTIDIAGAGFPIVNQVDLILDGFEDLIAKETADNTLDVIYAEEEEPIISSPLDGGVLTRLDVERSIVFSGERALKLTDLSNGLGSVFDVLYVNPINRDKCTFKTRFYGNVASVTWNVHLFLFDADITKYSEWRVTGITTQSWELLSIDLTTVPYQTGLSPVDLKKIKRIEIITACTSGAANSAAIFDEMQWVGGALNGVEVVSGDLKTQASADQFWNSNPSAPFWSTTPTQQFWASVNYLDGIYEWTSDVEAADLPCDLRIELSDPGVPYQLLYKPLGSFNFVPFPGVLQGVEEATYSFQLRLAGGLIRASVDQLFVILDVEDEQEEIKEFSVSNTGTVTLPLVKTYREIRTVIGQPQGSGVALPEVLNKNVSGPSVTVKDTAGTRITKTVDWFVKGVKG